MLWRIDSRGIHRIGIASLSSLLCKRLYIVITPANVYIYCYYYFHTCAKFIYYYHPCTRVYIIIIIFTPVQSLYIIITPANVCKLYISIPPCANVYHYILFSPLCKCLYIIISPLQMFQNYPSVRTLRFVCTCNNPAGTFSDSARSRQFSPHGSGPSGSSFELNAFLLIKPP